MHSISEHELTYIHKPVRAAQDDRMLYQCLINSLSKQGKEKVTVWSSQYIIGLHSLPLGCCLLKLIIRESCLDTNATTTMIRTKLSNLDSYIQQVRNDITKFNGHIQILIQTLRSRGKTTTDLLTNLFKGYGSCSDKTFVTYIQRKQEEYDEGKDISADVLIELANAKYQQMKDKEIWEAPDPTGEHIIALEAKLAAMHKRYMAARNSPLMVPTPPRNIPKESTAMKATQARPGLQNRLG